MPFRVQLIFNDGSYGWSESYWDLSSPNLTTSLYAAGLLAQQRVTLIGDGNITLDWIRCSDPTRFRASQIARGVAKSNPNAPYNKQWASFISDRPYSVFLVRALGTVANDPTVYASNLYMSGIADYLVDDTQPGGVKPDPLWSQLFSAWVSYLTTTVAGGNVQTWGFRVTARSAPTNPLKTITAIQQVAPYAFTVPAHGFVNGQKVRLVGVFGCPQGVRLNGVYRISLVPSADSFILAGWPRSEITSAFGGQVQGTAYAYAGFSNASVLKATHHTRGRGFFRPLGRHKRRPLVC